MERPWDGTIYYCIIYHAGRIDYKNFTTGCTGICEPGSGTKKYVIKDHVIISFSVWIRKKIIGQQREY